MKHHPLLKKRIAIAGARRFAELSAIIEKQGGSAVLYPMMSSSDHDDAEVARALKEFALKGTDWLILVTGVGTRALLEKAEALGLAQEIRQHMAGAKIAIRGYKTQNVLKTLALKPDVVDADGTVEGLRKELGPFDFASQRVTVQLHGERMPQLSDWLSAQGAEVLELPLYFYNPPAEEDVRALIYEILSAKLDALAFTSNTQVHFFFEAAERLGALLYLREAFADKVVALSVGSMTSKALREWGIVRIVAPEHERMGAMVMALAQFYETKKPAQVQLPVMLTQVAKTLVVGGGKVAARKVKSLLDAGIHPVVVSSDLSHDLAQLVQEGRLEHIARPYSPDDLTDTQLVIAATNDAELNAQIAKAGLAKGLLCNVVDRPEWGNFTSLATLRRGDLSVSVASDGASPAFSKYLKTKLETLIPEVYGQILEHLAQERETLMFLTELQREAVFDALCSPERLELFEQEPEQIPLVFEQILNELKELT